MHRQRGFTLMELMVAIAIIAILSVIAPPGYQRYLNRAALTDMLRSSSHYHLAVELCAMQQGDIDSCNAVGWVFRPAVVPVMSAASACARA